MSFEQRRSPRLKVPPTGGSISVVGARLLNVSSYGVLIESLLPMDPEQTMPLRLVVLGEKVDVEARVVVCRPAPTPRRHHVGLEFLSVPPEFKPKLAEALHQLAEA